MLLAVAVLGSTEYGTIDPVDAVVAARDRSAAAGLGILRARRWRLGWLPGHDLPGRRRQPAIASTKCAPSTSSFPAPEVYEAFAALGSTDSVTVDPHKLGYLPFGAGAFICRDHRAMALLAEEADYVFHDHRATDYLTRYRSLGQFIPEGSKSGASAAAVYVTHKVLPLDHRHFGRLLRQTVLAAEAFHARALAVRRGNGRHRQGRGALPARQQSGLPGAESAGTIIPSFA